MRTRLFSILFLLLTAVMGTWAQNVTPEQAKQIAAQFLQGKRTDKSSKRAPGQNELKTAVVFNAKDASGQPFLYAVTYTRQKGFVLVSGDERFVDVLGYSDNSTFDEHNMPDNMRAFLQDYIDEMQYLKGIDYQPSTTAGARRAAAAKSDISPLVTTTWNQGDPYNQLCPEVNGNRTVTGCVATAMAQIVNYHMQNCNKPTAIVNDVPAYTTTNTEIEVAGISKDTPLPNKAHLLNNYNSSDATSREAVAKLMLYCGVALKMNYSTSGSSAQTSSVPVALINYFGFDSTTRFIRRSDYYNADWIDLIYSELANGRPIMLSATKGGADGHAFVVDGYRTTNSMFHINWGWGGYLNDYFALSVLDPDDSGQIGAVAGTMGYASDQQAVVGIQIGSEESMPSPPQCMIAENVRVEGQDVYFFVANHTGSDQNFDISLGAYSGNMIQPVSIGYTNIEFQQGYGANIKLNATDPNFANMTKKLVIASKVNGTQTWYAGADPDKHYINAVYNANGVPTLTVHPVPNFQNTRFDIPENVYVNNPQNIHITLTNNGEEIYGTAYIFISTDTNDKGTCKEKRALIAETGVPTTLELNWTPTTADTYHLWVTSDEAGNNVIATTDVTVTDDPSLAGKTLAIVDYQLEGQDDQSFQIDGNGTRSIDVYGSKLKGKVTIKNLSASDYNYNGKYITLTYKKWNGSQFEMIAHPYDNGVKRPVLAGGKEYTFDDVDRDNLSAGLYQISLTTFEIVNSVVQNRTELDERYTINLKPIGMTIASASDWATFCTNVNGGNSYSGQLVKLTADITTSTGMDTNHTFSGVFDGGGHTLNITISGGSWNMAPFPVISGATIKNLTVTGSVTNTSNFTGGLVGQAMGNNNLIENCVVNTDVTGNMRIGGVVGQLSGSLTIKDVVYGGTITQKQTSYETGGFIGCYNNTDKSLTMTNCLFKGTYSGPSPFHPIGMKYNASKTFSTLSCTNCFYTVNPQNNPDAGVIIADGTKVSKLTVAPGSGITFQSGNTCFFQGTPYHYGTVTLNYCNPEEIPTYKLNGTAISGNSFTISKDNNIFDTGEVTITADISYAIIYDLAGGTVATPNPTTYSSSSNDITLNNPTRPNYVFAGWTGTGLDGAQMTVTIPTGSTGTRYYTATWTPLELSVVDGAYVINNKDDWELFCLRVDEGLSNYSGATVRLTDNIEDPVTTMAGTSETNSFQGTFDGQGHTLTIAYGTSQARLSESNAAPFRFVNGATIMNLHVTGSIYTSSQFAAGFIAKSTGNATILNSRSSVAINSSINYDGTHGCFIAVTDGATITGCLFDGSMTTTNGTYNCGGFIGWVNTSGISVSNSVMAPSSVSSGMLVSNFVRNYWNSDFTSNCYYIPVTNLPIDQGKQARTISAGENVASLAISGTPTATYSVSGITVFGANKGIMVGSSVYAAQNDVVDLTLGTNSLYDNINYSSSAAGTLNQTGNTSATLTMPDANVTISATLTINELATDDSGAYVINTKDDWNRFCARVASGANNYNGATVKLTADIGTTQDPVTTMAGTDTNRFRGTFDGGGYTLTIGYGSSNDRFSEQFAAPFRHVIYATIQNLTVAGNIYTDQQYAAGFVGKANTAVLIKNCYSNVNITTSSNFAAGFVAYAIYSLTIENCRSSANIISSLSGDGTHGGFVGDIDNKDENITITGCLFDGSITTTNSTQHCGGFIGFTHKPSRTTISNSVMASSNVSSGMLDNTFVRYSGETAPTIENCYYIPVTNLPANQGKEAHTITAGSDIASLAIGGTATAYSVSGIKVYGANKGIMVGTAAYGANGDVVDLALTANSPTHYTVNAYTASAGDITTNSATSATLTMPNNDVTIGATWQPEELPTDDNGNYLIADEGAWNAFCIRVNNGNDYADKTVKLTVNIGDAENPVTTMVGEYYYDSELSVQVDHRFKGTFDGAGNTLTIGYGTSENRFNEQYAAPFRHVKGATIQNLHVAGNIYIANQCAAGLVGQVSDSRLILTNCRSSVNIYCNYEYSGLHAGLVARIDNGVNENEITSCLFDGSFTTSNNDGSCGGFFAVAGGTTTLTDCVVKPSSVSAGMLSNTFGYGESAAFNNCYYVPVTNLPTNQGKEAHTITAGIDIASLAISGTPTATYSVSGIKVYGANKGIMLGTAVYAANGDEVDLALTANPPTNCSFDAYTASAGSITTISATSATLTMPNEDVTINAVYLVSTNYIAADGTSQSHAAKQLTSSDHELTSGWYVVNSDVTINPYLDCNNNSTRRINVSGDVKLILADGATLDVTHIETPSVSGGIHVPAGSSLTIYRQSGGTGVLNASTNSSDEAAIGGGYPGLGWGNAHAGTITIYGGTINAIAYDSGIGGTQGSHGGTVNIYGGTVTAQCNMGAAIGGGGSCTGFTVNIFGGTVNATGGTGAAAIGGGDGGSGGTVTISGGVINATANYSTYLNDYEGYGIGGGSDCNSPTTVNLSWTNTTDRITATSYNGTVNLKKAFQDTDGATWSAADNISTKPDGKTLYPANTLLFLADNADNSADISAANGNTRNVVLIGRTLIKDGNWNTLCLPFNLTAAQIAAHADFAGATLMELNTDGTNGFDTTDGTLHLAFKEATAIVAGVPYLVKWDAAGDDFTSPVFSGVTIDAKASTTVSDADTGLQEVQMVGCYSPVSVVANDKSILFMGDNNTLYYSTENRNIRSCRAYFSVPYLKQNPGAKTRAFHLEFGDEETTGIITVNGSGLTVGDSDTWYTIDGVRLSGKPTQRGMYIHKGNKVVIK